MRVKPVLTIGNTTVIEGRTGGDHGYVELASNFTNPGVGVDDAINTIITTGPDAVRTTWDKARGKRPRTYVPSTRKKVDEYSEEKLKELSSFTVYAAIENISAQQTGNVIDDYFPVYQYPVFGTVKFPENEVMNISDSPDAVRRKIESIQKYIMEIRKKQ